MLNGVRLSVAVAALVAWPANAASVFPAVGGPGGSAWSESCPAHHALVGIRARTGAWLDQVRPICAPLLPNGDTGSAVTGDIHGGPGGGPEQRTCQRGFVIVGMKISVGNKMVAGIEARCRSLSNGSQSGFAIGPGRSGPGWFDCPNKEIASGLHGRSGTFVDAVGLRCAIRNAG